MYTTVVQLVYTVYGELTRKRTMLQGCEEVITYLVQHALEGMPADTCDEEDEIGWREKQRPTSTST